MLNTKSLIITLSMATSIAAACHAQNCDGCHSSSFGYPVANSYGGGIAGHHQARKERKEEWKAEAEKIRARNDAWPKPFACHDRMAYYAVWNPMIQQGYDNHCILGDGHFQSESNQLNSAGQAKVANIMRNLPVERRQIFVTRSDNASASQSRLAYVNQLVQSVYGETPIVALTDQTPNMISGAQADGIVRRSIEGQPSPVIPVVSVGQGISSTTQQ